jgi:hypothetical protein
VSGRIKSAAREAVPALYHASIHMEPFASSKAALTP